MPQHDPSTTEEPTTDHPASDVETIVVDPDDIVETLRRNWRDETEQRSHSLRISPPFEGEQQASPHVSQQGSYYPPEMEPKPIHLGAAAFLVGHDAGSRHPDFQGHWHHPDRGTAKAEFRDEYDARGPDGENRPLTDEEQTEWEEYWATVVEVWEDQVRGALVDELTLTQPHTGVETTVGIRYEED